MFIVCYKRALLISDGVNETTRVPRIVPYACAECAEFWLVVGLSLSHVDCGGCIAALHSARVGVGGRGAGNPRTARHAAHSHRERRPWRTRSSPVNRLPRDCVVIRVQLRRCKNKAGDRRFCLGLNLNDIADVVPGSPRSLNMRISMRHLSISVICFNYKA